MGDSHHVTFDKITYIREFEKGDNGAWGNFFGKYKDYKQVDDISYSPPPTTFSEEESFCAPTMPQAEATNSNVSKEYAAAPPTPFRQQPPTGGAVFHEYKLIEDWHLKSDACIYQGPTEHSSTVVSVQGNLISTRSGSTYRLGKLDRQIMEVLSSCSPGAFDPLNPLSPSTSYLLLHAANIVYGPASQPIKSLVDALQQVEEKMGFAEVVAAPFASIRQILRGIGVNANTLHKLQ